jgi:hypothetical protein
MVARVGDVENREGMGCPRVVLDEGHATRLLERGETGAKVKLTMRCVREWRSVGRVQAKQSVAVCVRHDNRLLVHCRDARRIVKRTSRSGVRVQRRMQHATKGADGREHAHPVVSHLCDGDVARTRQRNARPGQHESLGTRAS